MYWQGYQLIAFEWVLLAIAALLLGIRLYVQLKPLRKEHPFYREVLVILSFVCYFATVIIDSFLNAHDNFNMEANSDPPAAAVKLTYTEAVIYFPGLVFCKMELLFLYHELAPRAHNPKIFILLVISWITVIASFGITTGWLLFGCWPFALHYSQEDDRCWSSAFYYSTWAAHIISDLFVYITPIIIISQLQKLTLSKKIGAIAMFIIGFVNVLCAGIIILCIEIPAKWNSFMTFVNITGTYLFFSPLQQATAIWIVCAPQLTSFWKYIMAKFRKDKGDKAAAFVIKEEPKRRPVRPDIESCLVPTVVETGTRTTATIQEEPDERISPVENPLEKKEAEVHVQPSPPHSSNGTSSPTDTRFLVAPDSPSGEALE